jgi:hypothetical protein
VYKEEKKNTTNTKKIEIVAITGVPEQYKKK